MMSRFGKFGPFVKFILYTFCSYINGSEYSFKGQTEGDNSNCHDPPEVCFPVSLSVQIGDFMPW